MRAAGRTNVKLFDTRDACERWLLEACETSKGDVGSGRTFDGVLVWKPRPSADRPAVRGRGFLYVLGMGEERIKIARAPRVTTSLAVAVCILALSASAARAVSLAEGVQAYEDMELDTAAETLTKALRTAAPKDKPRVELWLAIVELERGNDATAHRWLESALRADPTITVEHELSPKVLAAIESVRATVTTSAARSLPSAPPASAMSGAPQATVTVPPAALVPPPPPGHPTPAPSAAGTSPASTAPSSAERSDDVDVAVAPIASVSASEPSPSAMGMTESTGPSTLVYVTAVTGAVAAGALAGGAVLGAIARVGSDAAEREAVAAIATERYQEASTAAFTANSLFIAGGVAAVASLVCGVLVFVDGEGDGV